MSYQMDVNYVLSRAESLCLQLQQQAEDLPDHIKELINQPANTISHCCETPVHNAVACAGPSRQNDSDNTTNENRLDNNSRDIEVQNNSNAPLSQQQRQIGPGNDHGDDGDEGPSSEEVVELIATAHSVF